MTDERKRAEASQGDVAALLEGLRAEVRARRRARGQLEPTPLESDLERSLDEIELYRVVSAHWPLTGTTLPQRAIALVNKLVRRYLRWYINPIVEQQNAYNDAVARALRCLAEAYADLGEQIVDLRSTAGDRPPTTGGRRAASDDQRPASDARYPSLPSGPALPRERSPQSLMEQLAARVAAEPPARFPDLELRALEPHLRLRENVIAHWPLAGTTLPQRAIVLVNKLARRYLRWYINPIVEQQNAANAAITAALLALTRLDAERRAQVAAIRARNQGTGGPGDKTGE
jgi:hypothetical protein